MRTTFIRLPQILRSIARTKTELVLPEIRVVGNAFISLMAYQAKGYAYIAP